MRHLAVRTYYCRTRTPPPKIDTSWALYLRGRRTAGNYNGSINKGRSRNFKSAFGSSSNCFPRFPGSCNKTFFRRHACRRTFARCGRKDSWFTSERSGARHHSAHGTIRRADQHHDRIPPGWRVAHDHAGQCRTNGGAHEFEDAPGRHLPRRESSHQLEPTILRGSGIHFAPAGILGRKFSVRRTIGRSGSFARSSGTSCRPACRTERCASRRAAKCCRACRKTL